MYDSLIIGSGQIAGGFDSPKDMQIVTHAHAYKEHKDFNLLGFYDIDFSRAQEMTKKWGGTAFENLNEIKSVDVISICTPDEFHLSALKQSLQLNPKIIFLEKPLSSNIEEAKEILEIAKRVPILVNYSRRFMSDFLNLSKQIEDNEYGAFIAGSGYYGKGFIHNGSHMTNLINLLIGKIQKTDFINQFEDFYQNDLTKSVILTLKNDKKIILHGIDCNNFTIFELDLIFEKSRIRILESGQKIEVYEIKENEKFAGYKNLSLKNIINTDADSTMLNAVENIYQYLENNQPLKSTVEKAFEAINYG